MYTLRHAGLKGIGVFAAKHLPKGTRILSEQPLLLVRTESDVFALVRHMPLEKRKSFLQLSVNPLKQSRTRTWSKTIWHVARYIFSESSRKDDGTTVPTSPFSQSIINYPTALNVFRNNNFDLGNSTQAVFSEISRVNHACIPNAQANFNTATGHFTVHAVKDIEQDEELTINYLAEYTALREARQSRLMEGYGFYCDCPACNVASKQGQEGELRRQELRRRIRDYAEKVNGQAIQDARRELYMNMVMVDLFETEGIAGRELATLYLASAELAAKLKDEKETGRLVEQGLRLDQDCLGTDNPLFHESMERARKITEGLVY